jgi:hypothetical protein
MEIRPKKKYKKKGLIFALDAALAVTIVVIMVINSTYYFSVASKSSISHLQLVKVGGDVITVLDYTGELDAVIFNNSKGIAENSFNITEDMLNVSRLLPPNYAMWISISDLKESVFDDAGLGWNDGDGCYDSQLAGLMDGNEFTILTEPIERDMVAMLQVNITSRSEKGGGTGGERRFNAFTPGSPLKTVTITPDGGVYVFGPFSFTKGVNTVTMFREDKEICFHWLRVVGTEAYAGSTNETIWYRNLFPKDRFVGAGERMFIAGNQDVIAQNSTVEGLHLVRYRIWLRK